jgi:hypothetical protein
MSRKRRRSSFLCLSGLTERAEEEEEEEEEAPSLSSETHMFCFVGTMPKGLPIYLSNKTATTAATAAATEQIQP